MVIYTGISLCAGIGGLELGLRLALGNAYRTVCYVEREASVAAIIVARMADKMLDEASVWDDLRTFDGKPWRGKVHIITAGYPCQPFSCAGKQLGEADERHLWPDLARIIREVRPEWVFLENVPNHLRLGFAEVKAELEAMGFRVEAGLFTAAEVGASHLRQRLFVLAHDDELNGDSRGYGAAEVLRGKRKASGLSGGGAGLADDAINRLDGRAIHAGPGPEGAGTPESDRIGSELGDSGKRGRDRIIRRRAGEESEDGHQPVAYAECPESRAGTEGVEGKTAELARGGLADSDDALADTIGADDGRRGRRLDLGAGEEAGTGPEETPDAIDDMRENLGPFPPGPKDFDAWARVLQVAPNLEPAICVLADGGAPWLDEDGLSRPDQLRALGNAVVPACAAFAFCVLAGRMTE
jgi:DNA (cytosine-5)-methyltransferase 1